MANPGNRSNNRTGCTVNFGKTTYMKTINATVALLGMLFVLGACTPNMKFANSTIVPGATGNVGVRKDRNQNYTIQVSVVNLAEPQRLSPPKDLYLVWMESDGNLTQKLGRITTKSGLFSKAMKADLSATTTLRPNRIFISAETNPDVSIPEGPVVLTTN